jgi:DNA polymerase I-like protein with 3'-5' exonuclease and polymerase domains
MKDMEGRHPLIAQLRQVRKTLAKARSRPLVVDLETQRHYYSTSVFRSVTGRNQPRNFVFSGPKWLRQLIVPESPDHVLVYVDFIAQEVGIAAALSKDPTMRAIYEESDCHLAFAIRAGAAPADATKETHRELRNRYKTVNLGVLYGQTAFGIAARLGLRPPEAEALLEDHRALFPRFWEWSERIVQGSFDRGWIVTPCGWRSHVPFASNERTWMNWPMQAAGADIMRLVITYLDRQNVRVLAPVHDGFLLSCRWDQIDLLREAVNHACRSAVEHVLPGFPLRWDFAVHASGRFQDEDGLPLWNRLQEIIKEPR